MCSIQGCAQIDTDPVVILQQQGAGRRGCGPTGTTLALKTTSANRSSLHPEHPNTYRRMDRLKWPSTPD